MSRVVRKVRNSWESWGEFNAQDVHKQYAITFKTPSYTLKEGAGSKKVLVELFKPSDESTSEPMEFMFLPRGPTAAAPASHLDMVDIVIKHS